MCECVCLRVRACVCMYKCVCMYVYVCIWRTVSCTHYYYLMLLLLSAVYHMCTVFIVYAIYHIYLSYTILYWSSLLLSLIPYIYYLLLARDKIRCSRLQTASAFPRLFRENSWCTPPFLVSSRSGTVNIDDLY
jgi:hypothetical protein